MKRIATAVLSLCLSLSAWAGAWGEGSFDNDDALDWVEVCAQAAGPEVVSEALQSALKSEMIEAPDGSVAVAAAEVIAAARGKASPALPAQLQAWLDKQPKEKIAALASQASEALERVKDPTVSELRQLWSEGKASPWLARIAELEARLRR